jgi:hypothetical protein
MAGMLSGMAQGSLTSGIPASVLAGAQPLSMAAQTPDVGNRAIRPTFFGPGGTGRTIAGILGDSLIQLGGDDPAAMHLAQRRSALEEQQANLDDRLKMMQIAALTRKEGQPQIEHVGNTIGRLNPDTGGFDPTYTPPTDAERYAYSMGAQPGTADWMKHLQDFTLHANGPTAFGQDQTMEQMRQQGRTQLEGARQTNRQTLKAIPTYGQLYPRIPGGLPGPGGGSLATVPTSNLPSQLR